MYIKVSFNRHKIKLERLAYGNDKAMYDLYGD